MSKRLALRDKHKAFVSEYVIDGNGAGAAVRAGYSARSAKVTASRLLTKANVQDALRARQTADATRLSITRDHVLEGLKQAVEDARIMGNPAAMISGWKEIGRLMGYYSPSAHRVEFGAKDLDLNADLRSMSNEELLARVAVLDKL